MDKTIALVALGLQILSVGISLCAASMSYALTTLSTLTVVILILGLRKFAPHSSIEKIVDAKVSERTRVLVAQMGEYEQQASTDALTGLLNRRGGEAAIATHIARSQRISSPISFLLLDIDHFKNINDQFGHATGDSVLASVAECLRDTLRASDVAVRWGGEEYLVCLPDTDLRGAVTIAEKIRLRLQRIEVRGMTPITGSIGCAELGQDDVTVALARADMNLYFAKSKGRNRVFPDFVQGMLDRI